MMIEDERSVSSTRCMMKTLRSDFWVLRVDSMRLMIEGMLVGPWMQARTRRVFTTLLFSLEWVDMSPSFRIVLLTIPRAGL